MKTALLLISIFGMGSAFSQIHQVEYLMHKADSLYVVENYEQSRYYYELAQRSCTNNPECTHWYSEHLQEKIFVVDSISAYTYPNKEFVAMLFKGDSMLQNGKDIYAMKIFDDANRLVPALHYPLTRITYIIENSEKVQEQLLILQAKQKHELYNAKFKEAKGLEEIGKRLEAYYRYLAISQEFHNDENAVMSVDRLFLQIEQDLVSFEENYNLGNELYLSGKYEKSKTHFEKALSLNSECNLCEQRLKYLDYYIEIQGSKKKEYQLIKEKANEDYRLGKYESAFYQYVALSKKNPADEEVKKCILELDEILQSELDEKIKEFNAKILLEKANESYMKKDFATALEYYIKLNQRYKDVIEFQSFVKMRITECQLELTD